ncbi:MAG: hypothetical protein ABSE80_07700 [Halobacteriota archaeon]|jgi:hypothetical protein
MTEYVIEYNNWPELRNKVSRPTLVLFMTAEKYVNGAIFQLKRVKEALMAEQAFLETHTYLTYVNIILRCFETIQKFNVNDREIERFLSQLKNPNYRNNLILLRDARDFIEHADGRMLAITLYGHPSQTLTIPLTIFIDENLVYYSREVVLDANGKEIKDASGQQVYQYYSKSVPITEQELDKVKKAHERIFGILNSREEDPDKYLSECPALNNFVSDTFIKSCSGSLRGIIEGISGGWGNIIKGGIYQNCAFPQI